MKAKILRHKNKKRYHGMIQNGILYRTGDAIVPQLFPSDWGKIQLMRSVKNIDRPFVNSIDDFDLINVIIKDG